MSEVPWRVCAADGSADVLTAVKMEIQRHRRTPLRCRLGFHDPAEWFAEFYAHVQVRRCYRCGCAVEARDKLTAANHDPSGLIEMYKTHSGRIADEWFRAMTPPHMNRGKATTGPG